MVSKPEQWTERLNHPRDVSYSMTLDGYGEMPERGLCYLFSDEQIRELVACMFDQVRRSSEDAGAH